MTVASGVEDIDDSATDAFSISIIVQCSSEVYADIFIFCIGL